MSLAFAFVGEKILLDDDSPFLAASALTPLVGAPTFMSEGVAVYVLPDTVSTQGIYQQLTYRATTLKPALPGFDENTQRALLRAYHWVQWHHRMGFCSYCGHALPVPQNKPEKTCPACKMTHFPRFSPAVIVTITRGHEILLARAPHFAPGIYSALAGFVELGETAEETLHREIMEEVGLRVKNVQYQGSQTWPFPDSFMMAFTADYASGELNIGDELEDARWFDKSALPKLPQKASISRKLIDLSVQATV